MLAINPALLLLPIVATVIGVLVFQLFRKLNLFGIFAKKDKTLIEMLMIVLLVVFAVWAIIIFIGITIHLLGFE
jgi:hypothetical protein